MPRRTQSLRTVDACSSRPLLTFVVVVPEIGSIESSFDMGKYIHGSEVAHSIYTKNMTSDAPITSVLVAVKFAAPAYFPICQPNADGFQPNQHYCNNDQGMCSKH